MFCNINVVKEMGAFVKRLKEEVHLPKHSICVSVCCLSLFVCFPAVVDAAVTYFNSFSESKNLQHLGGNIRALMKSCGCCVAAVLFVFVITSVCLGTQWC